MPLGTLGKTVGRSVGGTRKGLRNAGWRLGRMGGTTTMSGGSLGVRSNRTNRVLSAAQTKRRGYRRMGYGAAGGGFLMNRGSSGRNGVVPHSSGGRTAF